MTSLQLHFQQKTKKKGLEATQIVEDTLNQALLNTLGCCYGT